MKLWWRIISKLEAFLKKYDIAYSNTVHEAQGSKLKKSSGRLLATNWRNIVARCKFLVASSYNVNNAAHSQGF